MFGFLALCMFLLASYLTKKLRHTKKGLIALVVGLAGSMLLYRSGASTTAVQWANNTFMGPLAGTWGSWTGEALPVATVWSVVCIGGFIVTCIDLRYDHNYNPWAIFALLITPIAARGSAGGVITGFIDWIHTMGAGIAAWAVGGAVG